MGPADALDGFRRADFIWTRTSPEESIRFSAACQHARIDRIRPLDTALDAVTFRCGQRRLDDYIPCYASQDVRRGVARVFVATPNDDLRRLAGFFSLSAGSVKCADLPQDVVMRQRWEPCTGAWICAHAAAPQSMTFAPSLTQWQHWGLSRLSPVGGDRAQDRATAGEGRPGRASADLR